MCITKKRNMLYIAISILLCSTGFLQAQLTENLVAYYKMNSDSGLTVTDETGAHHGTLTQALDWIPGYEGNALQFVGGTGGPFVDLGAWQTNGPEGLGLAVWLRWDGTNGVYQGLMSQRDGTMYWWTELNPAGSELRFKSNTSPQSNLFLTGEHLIQGEWTHVAFSHDTAAGTGVVYLNGEERLSGTWAFPTGDFSNLRTGLGVVNVADGLGTFNGAMDEAMIFQAPFSAEDVKAIMQGLGNDNMAARPMPKDGENDVIRDSKLSWTPGEYAAKHNVYLGASFDDVNSAALPTASDLDVNSFDPGRLEFGKTYFWRVDEVNGTPDKAVYNGNIWSFTVEPYSIIVDAVTVTASSTGDNSDPNRLIDGSGLDADDRHSNSPDDMWTSANGDLSPSLMFELGKAQRLDKMLIWNSNHSSEAVIGWGIKDVDIEISVDGVDWTTLPETSQFTRGPGFVPSDAQAIDMGLVEAKYVRLNILTNWGGLLPQYGVGEVQFYSLPVRARTPVPASGSMNILPDAALSWRAGRDADQHIVYTGTDQNAVTDGAAQSVVASTNGLDLAPLDLQLGKTYYWRVDEVNEAEAKTVWAGPVWSLSTPAALVVDDFESYGNLSPGRPFQTWLDGFGYSADDFFPVEYGGNGTGAGIGHDIWSVSSPYFDGDIMETERTIAGSNQSMPFYFDGASETERTLEMNFTLGGVKTLSIPFRGQAGNTGALYVKINGVKVTYTHDAANLAKATWLTFNIDLASVNTNLSSITKLAIGVEGNASGMILIDDITLHAQAGEIITPMPPDNSSLILHYTFDEGTGSSIGDSSGHGYTGTFESIPMWATGVSGSAISLDGIASYVNVPVAVWSSVSTEFTVSFWAFGDAELGNNWGFYAGAGDQRIVSCHLPWGSDVIFDTTLGWNAERVFVGAAADELRGQWRHWTLVRNTVTGEKYAYMDGVLYGTALPSADPIAGVEQFFIGAGNGGGSPYKGMIDDFKIYNRALSSEEVLSLAGVTSPIDKPF